MKKSVVASIVAVVVLGGLGGAWWLKSERERRWKWDPIVMPERIARVPEVWTAETLASRLQSNDKLRDANAFLEAAREANLDRVEEGGYRLPAKAGPRELAKVFKAGPTLAQVTIPEGWTARRIAQRLRANNFRAADEFLKRAYPAGKTVSPWEGRLFPDTYLLPLQADAPQLATRLMDRFKEVAARLPKPFPRGANNKPLSLSEVVVLASLVERETSVPEERRIVAGVLLNRLRDGMRLQCDASVQYARQLIAQSDAAHKNRLLFRDLEIKSPYNTYQHKGLPPGPICNPGEASLRAAARPANTPHFFYVMSPKLGRHRFARTFAEHQRNVRLYRQERDAGE